MTHAPTPICFAGQQSYALQEDQVLLQAELALTPPGPCAPLALQLWAARADDAAVTIKLAELPVPLPQHGATGLIPVQGYAPLALPAGRFSWLLSLAVVESTVTGVVEHDRIRFPIPTLFDLPQLTGPVQAELVGDDIRLMLPGVFNPRAAGSLSGSLTVGLWALPQPYLGGAFTGVLLGQQDLGQLAGQTTLEPGEMALPLPLSLAGDWVLTLMLREWTGGGYLTRDYQGLPGIPAAAMPVESLTGLPAPTAPAPVTVSATAPEPATADTPAAEDMISVNTASVETLAALKGVGAKLATAIAAGRPYATLADLRRVKGVGEKVLARLQAALKL
ncbi:MAG TPA: ComEA family DNA-binding protein [Fluviicoccus sp.]|nr:ComEA family DNA-binding protein [Fluviicoccus sp.]